MSEWALVFRDVLLAALAFRVFRTPEAQLFWWERFAERALVILCLAHVAAFLAETL